MEGYIFKINIYDSQYQVKTAPLQPAVGNQHHAAKHPLMTEAPAATRLKPALHCLGGMTE